MNPRASEPFAFESEDFANPYEPLVLGKKMFIITAQGDSGFGPGDLNEKLNYQDPCLRTILRFIGIIVIPFIHVESAVYSRQTLVDLIALARDAVAFAAARTQVAQLVER